MKKIILILLTVMATFTLASCNAEEVVDNIKNDVEEGVKEGIKDAVSDIANSSNKAVSRGTIDGNVYTSEYSGLTFTKPESWSYYTDEEIAATMSAGEEILERDKFEETVATMVTVYDMMVIDNTNGTNISVAYENLKLTNNQSITEEQYLESIKQQLSSQDAMSVTINETSEVTLSGNTYLRVTTDVEYNDIQMIQVYYIRKIDDFMNAIIVTIPAGYTVSDIEAMFS